MTLAHVYTVAFEGIDAREVDVQVHIADGIPGFAVVGLADKAVAESRERVRAALSAIGLALPAKRITVNLAPADLPKEGSHYDLPIALGLLAAMGVLPASAAGLIGAAIIGFLGYGVSLVFFVLGLRFLGAARAGTYFSTAPFVGALLSVIMFGDALSLRLLAAGVLMAIGLYLHLAEAHEHEHTHDEMEHEHRHVHDKHHQHEHGPDDQGGEPHSHWHQHAPMTHRHPHYPDLHHRHRHAG